MFCNLVLLNTVATLNMQNPYYYLLASQFQVMSVQRSTDTYEELKVKY